MADYSFVADQMREEIIDDYLKKHPDVSRHEVVTKTVNGRIIVETVSNLFNRIPEKKQPPLPPNYKKLLDKLGKGGDERYAASLDSVSTCRNYTEWLCDSSCTGFGEKDRDENNTFLDKREDQLGRKSVELLYVRKKFTDMMSSKTKPQQSLIQTLTMEYISAMLAQLKVQGSIYNKEVDLGELFSKSARDFLSQNIDNFRGANDKVLMSIGKAFQFLKNESVQSVQLTGQAAKDHDALRSSLDQLGDHLNQRRDQYQMIQQLINFLENMLESLQNPQAAPQKPDKQSGSSNRMAITSRKEGRRSRR